MTTPAADDTPIFWEVAALFAGRHHWRDEREPDLEPPTVELPVQRRE